MYHSIYMEQHSRVDMLNRTERKKINALVGEVISDIHYLMVQYELDPLDESVLRDALWEMASNGFFDCQSSSTKFKKLEYIISGIARKYSNLPKPF